MEPVEFIIVGTGSRGGCYADFAKRNPAKAKLVGIAEPRKILRDRYSQQHEINPDNVVEDWRSLADRDKIADAVVISTLDPLHCEPALAFVEKGYHLLLEKPMAPTLEECCQIVERVSQSSVIMAVGHVLLYTNYTRTLRRMVRSGVIGKIVSIQHLEPVGYWHHAHSYVRGNWRNEANSSSMLLAKCCHDLDWIRHLVGERCAAIASFGNLNHFRREEKPTEAGTATRCTQCLHEPNCPYSAVKLYQGNVLNGNYGWPVDVVALEDNARDLDRALSHGNYGRCVYECDNDVVDHQVVSMQFDGGVTATLTMTAFTAAGPRQTRIFGTHGEIFGNGSTIEVTNFVNDEVSTIETAEPNSFVMGQHSAGDDELMNRFFSAIANDAPDRLLSGPAEALESHRMVFAAEQARREGTVVRL